MMKMSVVDGADVENDRDDDDDRDDDSTRWQRIVKRFSY
jgi:hypothetical protein